MRPFIPHVTPLPSFAAVPRPPVGKRPSRAAAKASRIVAKLFRRERAAPPDRVR